MGQEREGQASPRSRVEKEEVATEDRGPVLVEVGNDK
jgi:hypothetical protein